MRIVGSGVFGAQPILQTKTYFGICWVVFFNLILLSPQLYESTILNSRNFLKDAHNRTIFCLHVSSKHCKSFDAYSVL